MVLSLIIRCANLRAESGLSHLRLGIITDGSSIQQRKKLEQTGILDYFTIILTAEDAKAAKPSAHIFAQACQSAGEPVEACWNVGDNIAKDAIGASAVGMNGIWLNRSKVDASLPEVKSCHTLKEFVNLILESD